MAQITENVKERPKTCAFSPELNLTGSTICEENYTVAILLIKSVFLSMKEIRPKGGNIMHINLQTWLSPAGMPEVQKVLTEVGSALFYISKDYLIFGCSKSELGPLTEPFLEDVHAATNRRTSHACRLGDVIICCRKHPSTTCFNGGAAFN